MFITDKLFNKYKFKSIKILFLLTYTFIFSTFSLYTPTTEAVLNKSTQSTCLRDFKEARKQIASISSKGIHFACSSTHSSRKFKYIVALSPMKYLEGDIKIVNYDLYIFKLTEKNASKEVAVLKNWLESDYGTQVEKITIDEEMFNLSKQSNSLGIRISSHVIPRFPSIKRDWLSIFVQKNDRFIQVLDGSDTHFYISVNDESEETISHYSIKETLKNNMRDIMRTDTYVRKENGLITERITSTLELLFDGSTYQYGEASNDIPCRLC